MSESVTVANKKYISWDDNGQHLTKLLFQKIMQRKAHLPNDQKELQGKLWELANHSKNHIHSTKESKRFEKPRRIHTSRNVLVSEILWLEGL